MNTQTETTDQKTKKFNLKKFVIKEKETIAISAIAVTGMVWAFAAGAVKGARAATPHTIDMAMNTETGDHVGYFADSDLGTRTYMIPKKESTSEKE